ncbi:MAG TPA: TonB-dependent receptor, partial [Chitinophagaceae bacterium]|nr:TonB-dependent receptor [Chitinophagaceae bacterium]
MRKLFTFLLTALIFSSAVSAQKISGVVKDQQGKTLDKTTVSLLRSKDSSVVKLSVTDNDGKFAFDADAGQYLVSASHVAYAPTYSKPIELTGSGDVSVGDMSLVKKERSLEGVTVTSQKPMIEVKADKMIVNVEGTMNSVGNDALELLRKSPGVTVDKDDNISLAGKNGVQVYIDGKPSPLSGADLANYLKSMQSAQIESIEIISNPSAKYEAAGNAGIINIRLKKNKAFGTN